MLAAHHETPPQNSLHSIPAPFPFHDGLPGKVSEGGERESATSAIVANTLFVDLVSSVSMEN